MTNKLLILLLLVLLACAKEEIGGGYPRVKTEAVSDITALGAKFSATVSGVLPGEILDHGFVWGTIPELTLTSDYSISLGSATELNFSSQIGSLLTEHTPYYVRAFVKTSNHLVYGTSQQFISLGSLGPQVTSFLPLEGFHTDTIVVKGKNFLSPGIFLKAYFTFNAVNVEADIISASPDSVVVIVPTTLTQLLYRINISVQGNAGVSPTNFNLLLPSIISSAPANVKYCDSVTLTGSNFKQVVSVNDGVSEIPFSKKGNVIKFQAGKTFAANPSVNLSTPYYSMFKQIVATLTTPQILSTTPLNPAVGDSIRIKFNYLPPCLPVVGSINSTPVALVRKGADEVRMKVDPAICIPGSFNVKIGPDLTFAYGTTQQIDIQPITVTLATTSGTFGDQVNITLQNNFATDFHVYFGGSEATIVSQSAHLLSVLVPTVIDMPSGGDLPVQVTTCQLYAFSPVNFILLPPAISDFNPKLITHTGEQITLTGNYFNPQADQNIISFNGRTVLPASIMSASQTQITFIADDLISLFSETGKLSIKVAEQEAISTQDLQINVATPWTNLGSFPGRFRAGSSSFSLNGKGYLVLGDGENGNDWITEVWEYNPAGNQWIQLADFPGLSRSGQTSFVTGGFAYMGLGINNNTLILQDWWRFDPSNNQWTQMNNFPGPDRFGASSFQIQGTGYVGSGVNGVSSMKDLWRYDAVNDTWTELTGNTMVQPDQTLTATFTYNNKGYAMAYNPTITSFELYTYDPTGDVWNLLPYNPPSMNWIPSPMVFDNYAQFGEVRFYPDNLTDEIIAVPAEARNFANIVFQIGSKGYVGLGYLPQTVMSYTFAEFDSTK